MEIKIHVASPDVFRELTSFPITSLCFMYNQVPQNKLLIILVAAVKVNLGTVPDKGVYSCWQGQLLAFVLQM